VLGGSATSLCTTWRYSQEYGSGGGSVKIPWDGRRKQVRRWEIGNAKAVAARPSLVASLM
jgi:hypothetical protein